MKLLRKTLMLGHRYLGIAMCLLIMMWFATGILMMYAGGMPRLEPSTRLARMSDLDFSRVRLTPADAAARADLPATGGATLLSVMDRPAYRFSGRRPVTVFADTGEVMPELTVDQAQAVAASFVQAPPDTLHHAGTLTAVDQWTLVLSRQLPLHKFTVDDADGTQVYVSPRTGEVVMATTSRSRALAWMSTIPHWFYLAALRANQPLWYELVVWTSALACVVALLGLVLGVVLYRWRNPLPMSNAIPYGGWMRWHYVTGIVFGVFTVTWAFSGLLSMEPFAWTNARGLEVDREALSGGPLDLNDFGPIEAARWPRLEEPGRAIKEVELVRMQDEPYYIVHTAMPATAADLARERLHQPYPITGRTDPGRLVVSARTLDVRREPFSTESILARLRDAVPDAAVKDADLLADYDSYYYSRSRQLPLPVLRVRFDDPAATWVYVDTEMSRIVAEVHRLNRLERWLYNGLHSLDFSFWYSKRPLWDAGMLVLLLGGLTTSTIGFCFGVKRLRRSVAPAASVRTAPPIAKSA